MQAILTSFLLIAASEMGDKTQLLAFSLASRFRKPWPVLAGILVATLANHALAATLGRWLSGQIPPRTMSMGLGIIFLAFGFWMLKPDEFAPDNKPTRMGPFLTTAGLFFLAEMGDKTQLATVALAARFNSVVAVTAGTTLGMLFADGLAVFAGHKLADKVQSKWVRLLAAGLFIAFGIAALIQWRGQP